MTSPKSRNFNIGFFLDFEHPTFQGRWRRGFELIEFFRSSGHTGGLARAESPTSSEPRATPWVNVRTTPAPCKGKSKSQSFAHTFALTGRRRLCTGTQGVALGWELAALSGRSRRGLRAALRGLKAQQVRSPGQRPGLTYVPHRRPVRAKVINNRCAHTFALTGRRALYPDTQGVALGWGLAALSGRSRRNSSLFPQRGHEIR